jgi:hypothetical protein
MKGAFLGILLALTPLGCTPATRQAADVADQVNTVAQCGRFDEARQQVYAARARLTKQQIEKAKALNRLAAIHCATTLPELTAELLELAEETP